MVIAVFKGSDIARVYDLWQWDYGQKLRIQGLDLPTAVEIHFSLTESSGESITRVGNTVDGVTDVIIPDSMLENETALQSTYNIYAFIYLTDDTSGETVKKIVMEVKTRPKPEAFDAPEDAELFREAIQAVNDAADRAKVSETNASDSAASAQSDAAKTTADRLEVERLVQSVSGIEDEVKVVEQYKEQAIQAAQTAGTSEQNAKASETAAQVAQKAAESAKALTEQYKTAAAESANTSVQAAANAEESARSAEQSASQTAQIAQAAVQNIEQAGSDQVNAVNDAGESQKQAVNSVGTSQVEAVTNAGATQVEEVNSAGEEKVEEIQQKGQQVLDSIPQDYNTAMAGKLDKQQGRENAGKVMTVGEDGNVAPTDAPQGMTTEQKQQLDKATADIKDLYNTKANAIMDTLTGNPVVIKTAGEGLGVEIEMQGWTEQVQTIGNQLFDVNNIKNVTVKIGERFGCEINLDPGNYIVTPYYDGVVKGDYLYLQVKHSDGSFSNDIYVISNTIIYKNVKFEISEGDTLYFYNASGSQTQEETIDKFSKYMFMMNKGSTSLPYEPYTGNAPSPSPEYPQEIINAGRYNEETQKYEVEVNVSSGNLFDKNTVTENTILNKTDGSLSQNGACVTSDFISVVSGFYYTRSITNAYGTCFYDKNKNFISSVTEVYTFEIPENAKYLRFSINKILTDLDSVMLVCGKSLPSFFIPYQEPQTVTVTSDRPITKWDRLIEKDGQIGWEYGSEFYTADGSEDIGFGSGERGDTVPFEFRELIAIKNSNGKIKVMSDKFLGVNNNSWNMSTVQGIYAINSGHIQIRINLDSIEEESIQAFKSWLTEHNVNIFYQTNETTFVPLPPEEQEAFRELKTYFPISVISNDQECQMDITYAMDTKAYIDKKFEELQSALVTTNSILLGGE